MVNIAAAINGAVRPNKSLLEMAYSLCSLLTKICCALVANTPIKATTVPQKFIDVSCTVATPTPNMTTAIACAIFADTFLPKNTISNKQTVGICNNFAN